MSSYHTFKKLLALSQHDAEGLHKFVDNIVKLLDSLHYKLDDNIKLDMIYACLNETTIENIPRNNIRNVEDLLKTCEAIEMTKVRNSSQKFQVQVTRSQTQPSSSPGSRLPPDIYDAETMVYAPIKESDSKGKNAASENHATSSSKNVNKKLYTCTSDDNKLKIIAAVYKHRILWRPENKATSPKEMIPYTWMKLEKELGIKGVQRRWSNLMHQYRKHLLSGTPTKLPKVIIKKMEFMKKYIEKKSGEKISKSQPQKSSDEKVSVTEQSLDDNHPLTNMLKLFISLSNRCK